VPTRAEGAVRGRRLRSRLWSSSPSQESRGERLQGDRQRRNGSLQSSSSHSLNPRKENRRGDQAPSVSDAEGERSREGEVRPDLPEDTGLLWVHDHRQGQAGGQPKPSAVTGTSWRRGWPRIRTRSRRSSSTTCAGCSSTTTRVSYTRESSIPISTSTPKTRSRCSARPESIVPGETLNLDWSLTRALQVFPGVLEQVDVPGVLVAILGSDLLLDLGNGEVGVVRAPAGSSARSPAIEWRSRRPGRVESRRPG
jgi:hypothetical protein